MDWSKPSVMAVNLQSWTSCKWAMASERRALSKQASVGLQIFTFELCSKASAKCFSDVSIFFSQICEELNQVETTTNEGGKKIRGMTEFFCILEKSFSISKNTPAKIGSSAPVSHLLPPVIT